MSATRTMESNHLFEFPMYVWKLETSANLTPMVLKYDRGMPRGVRQSSRVTETGSALDFFSIAHARFTDLQTA